jgi:Ca2+-dependent lipid-binding protein
VEAFVELIYENIKYRTHSDDERGFSPVWNHVFTIPISSELSNLKISLLSDDVLEDELIGEALISIREFLSQKSTKSTKIPIKRDGSI